MKVCDATGDADCQRIQIEMPPGGAPDSTQMHQFHFIYFTGTDLEIYLSCRFPDSSLSLIFRCLVSQTKMNV